MKNPKKNIFARTSVVVFLLGALPACVLNSTESIDDQDMNASMGDESDAQLDIEAALDIDELLMSGHADDVGEIVSLPGDTQERLLHAGLALDPDEVHVESIIFNGTGCPSNEPNSLVARMSVDKKAVVLEFKDMRVVYSPGQPGIPVVVRNCGTAFKLEVPQGWQFSLAAVRGRGDMTLAEDVNTRYSVNFSFAGAGSEYSAEKKIEGPTNTRFTFYDEVPPQSVDWSRCGGTVLFQTNTLLTLNAVANTMGVGNTGVRRNDFLIEWRKC